eukprot:s786_g23.t1
MIMVGGFSCSRKHQPDTLLGIHVRVAQVWRPKGGAMFWFWRKQEAKAAGQDLGPEEDEEATQAATDQPVEQSKLRRLLADLDDDASDHSDDSYIFLNESERNDEEGAQDPSDGPSTQPAETSDLPSTASGKGKGKGPPPPSKGSGKGKGKAPPPPAGKGVKGKGKTSAPPAPPKGAGKAEPKSQPKGPALPIGRRLSLKPSSVTAEAFNLVTARGEDPWKHGVIFVPVTTMDSMYRCPFATGW